MPYKSLLIIPFVILSLSAQQTPDYPDTSNQPDTSMTPDTSTVPDDTAEYPEDTTTGYNGNGNEESVANDGSNEHGAPTNVYLGVGIGNIFNLETDNPTYQAFIGKMWGLGDYVSINAMIEGASNFDDAWWVDGVLSLDLYPLPAYTAFSPYIGFGAGLGWVNNSDLDEDGLGLNLSAKVGLRLFKNSPFGFIIEGNASWLVQDIVGDQNPVFVGARAGIAF
ncbi:MAG TPA: hypothetical protein VHP36_08940 [Chitinispirillaceae bacterium]|nr:hypothetical protein [Chitinispirillaceae bacterium]